MSRIVEPSIAEGLASERWCLMCGSDHGPAGRCPGEIPATGPERHAWRVTALTGHGLEAYGVLLAPSGHRWRARILTYPNVLWLVPGGTQSLKILSRSPGDAERRARDLIREHCLARGQTMRDELVAAGVVAAPPRRAAASPLPPATRPTPMARPASVGGVQQSPRFLRTLPVRFGTDRPAERATTRDLSEGGLFVHTASLLEPHASIGILLQLEHCTLPLRGAVVWRRSRTQPERPVGMGVHLVSPPPAYVSYVRALG